MPKKLNLAFLMVAVWTTAAHGQSTVTTSGGTTYTVPVFSGSTAVVNSAITSDSSGNVGIGTSSPDAMFQVSGSSDLLNYGGSGVKIFGNGDSTNYYIGHYAVLGSDGLDLHWYGGVRLSDSSGTVLETVGSYVGIGTTSPGAKLEVNGGVKLSSGSGGNITFADGTSQNTAYTSGSAGTITTGTWNGTPLTSAYIPEDVMYTDTTQAISGTKNFTSNVGIGTATPQASLDVEAFSQSGNGIGLNLLNTSGLPEGGSQTRILFAGGDRPNGFAMIQSGGTDWSSGNGFLGFQVAQGGALEEGMRLTAGGNVGIGTTSPGEKLEVNGNMKLSGTGSHIQFVDGSDQSTAWTGTLTGGDYAESVDVTGDRNQYEPGDVLVVDPDHPGHFLKATERYSLAVTGVYSTKPGVVGRRQKIAKALSTTEVPMAMVGIVPTKVTAENGPIKPGDVLVTSSTPGCAMKGTDRSMLAGAVIGKALEPLNSGIGMIEAVISLQ